MEILNDTYPASQVSKTLVSHMTRHGRGWESSERARTALGGPPYRSGVRVWWAEPPVMPVE